MIDFPNTPTIGQEFTSGDNTWKWTGEVWDLVPIEAIALTPESVVRNRNVFEGRVSTLIAISQTDYDGLTTEQKEEQGTIFFIINN